jgi:hypothetical protein
MIWMDWDGFKLKVSQEKRILPWHEPESAVIGSGPILFRDRSYEWPGTPPVLAGLSVDRFYLYGDRGASPFMLRNK